MQALTVIGVDVHKEIVPLLKINQRLWDIEDEIRMLMKQRKKIPHEVAESVPITNDRRSEIKRKINEKYGSENLEVKLYKRDGA